MNATSRNQTASNEPALGSSERWVSAALGGTLALWGLSKRSVGGTAVALLGGYLLYRGTSGSRPLSRALSAPRGDRALAGGGIHVEKAVTINKSPAELYAYWRNFENLPRFMNHLESVKTLGGGRSHWVAKAPLGTTVEWDAEITEEKEGERIAWRSLEGADVASTGSVRFKAAPAGRGTEVRVSLDYRPPAGALGAAVAKLFGEEPESQIGDDLSRFKALMEAGEVPTTQGQPSGRGRD